MIRRMRGIEEIKGKEEEGEFSRCTEEGTMK